MTSKRSFRPKTARNFISVAVGAALACASLSVGATAAGAVTAGPVTQLVVNAPTSAPGGAAVTITVTAEDSGGNTVTTFPDTIHFASSDPAAVLPPDDALTNGTAMFSVTFNTVGAATLSVTDTATGSTLPAATAAVIVSTPSTGTVTAPSTLAVPPVAVESGADRIATAIAVSQAHFPTAGSAGGVVLARSDAFPDALAGGPLAAAKNAPLLLTGTASLDPRVQAEISRVLPAGGTVYLLGGTATLSAGVAATLSALGFNVVRYAGVDRYDTAAQVATNGLGSPATALLATGNSFADALAGGPAAVAAGGAILLTDDASMPSATATYLAAHTTSVYALGGPAAAADPAATAVVGADRFATAAMVATRWFSHPTSVGFASGADFPDALAGDAQMGESAGPMLLLDPTATSVPSSVATYLESVQSGLTSAFAFGGNAALPSALLSSVQASAAATGLEISAPASTTVGTPFQVTVTATTANGTIAAGFADTVQLSSTDPGATLPAAGTLTAGSATLTLTLSSIGTQTVTVTDTTTAGVTAGSTTITVNV